MKSLIASKIVSIFEGLATVCEGIKEFGACSECPLKYICLDDTSTLDLADLLSEATWSEFLEYAKESHISDADAEADYADRARKADMEEAMIDEEYGYGV